MLIDSDALAVVDVLAVYALADNEPVKDDHDDADSDAVTDAVADDIADDFLTLSLLLSLLLSPTLPMSMTLL